MSAGGRRVALFRKKQPAPVRQTHQPGRADTQTVRAIGQENGGCNPYDTAPDRPSRPRGVQREGAHLNRAAPGDPYGTADRGPKKRSWDDAFIDTWVEHRPKRR